MVSIGVAAAATVTVLTGLSVQSGLDPYRTDRIRAAMTRSVQIWDPNLARDYMNEPLAKSVIRKFDAYNMARGGRDDTKTFVDADVARYLAPDLLYESVGFGTWETPHGWAHGEEAKYGAAFPETIFTQILFWGDQKGGHDDDLWQSVLVGRLPWCQGSSAMGHTSDHRLLQHSR